MQEYYVFQTEQLASACVNALNAQPYYPVTGRRNGSPATDKQKTVRWTDGPSEMLTGEWAVDRVPASTLDYVGAPQEDRSGFLAVHGQDIRELDHSDFPSVDINEDV